MNDQQSQPTEKPRRAAPRFDYGSAPGEAHAAVATAKPAGVHWLNSPKGLALLVCAAIFAFLFHNNFSRLESVWYADASWSHGYGIPVLAAILTWMSWDRLGRVRIEPSWIGLAILIYGVASFVLFEVTGQSYLSNMTLVVVLNGLVLFIFGWEVMRVMWLPIGYLTLMINLPATLYAKITTPLQLVAAQLGVWFLPILGISAEKEGTVINVLTPNGIQKLEVEQACSGIRMLIAFVALAVMLAYSTHRPMWQKVFLTFSSLPVAILCNSFRVTLTGYMHVHMPQYAEGAAHQYLGLLMLIPAMGIQLGIGMVLDRIFVESSPETGGAA